MARLRCRPLRRELPPALPVILGPRIAPKSALVFTP
jgi:hypothetical protein